MRRRVYVHDNLGLLRSQPSMANAAFSAGWNGWVLYTSEEGYKYHWNHLTHESRWATDEAYTQDREAEVYPCVKPCIIRDVRQVVRTVELEHACARYERYTISTYTC